MTLDVDEQKMKLSRFLEMNPMALAMSQSEIVYFDSLFSGPHFSGSLFSGLSKHISPHLELQIHCAAVILHDLIHSDPMMQPNVP